MAEGFIPDVLVTGGQTGADSIALQVRDEVGIPVKGFMPNGFKRDDGAGADVARKYGLMEGEGGYKWRDQANAAMADACVGFLCTKPQTGRGTMQTLNMFVNGEYAFVPVDKPADDDVLVIPPGRNGARPVIVLWDVRGETVGRMGDAVSRFLNTHRPRALMVSGSVEDTWPGTTEHGAAVLLAALAKNGVGGRRAGQRGGAGLLAGAAAVLIGPGAGAAAAAGGPEGDVDWDMDRVRWLAFLIVGAFSLGLYAASGVKSDAPGV